MGEGPAHYFSDTPDGAWAEFLRHEEITEPEDLTGIRRALWAIDLGHEPPERPALPLAVSTGAPDTYGSCQSEARRLRAQGAAAMTAPSAAVARCSERLASGRWLPSRPGARRQGLRPIRFASGSGRLGCYRCRPPGQRASAPRASLLTTTTITSPVPCWRSNSIVLTIRCSAIDAGAPAAGLPARPGPVRRGRRSIGRATGCGCGGARQEHGAVGKAPFLHVLDAGLWYAVVEWRSVGDAPGAGSGGRAAAEARVAELELLLRQERGSDSGQ